MPSFHKLRYLLGWETAIGIIYVALVLTLIVFEINQRLDIQMQISARSDSPMTLVFQFDREVLRLRQAIRMAALPQMPIDREELQLRQAIAHSRMELLNNSSAAAEVVSSRGVRDLLDEFSVIDADLEKTFNMSAIKVADLGLLLQKLDELQPRIQGLSFETNNRIYRTLEKNLQASIKQINFIIFLLAAQMVVLLIGFAIFKSRQTQLQELNDALELRVQERTEAKAEAESANRSKSRFLAAASHDLRQPMAALALYTGMLGTVVTNGNERLVGNIQNCVDSLSKLLNDLLDVSKLESGAVVTTLSSFTIDELCDSMQANYGASAAQKGLSLRCRHAPNIVLRTDQQLFKRVLGNLIDNSLKFTMHGGVLIATRKHQGRMWVEVWDTGIGISHENFVNIFEEFRQLGDSSRNRGCGLGLTIAAKISARLGLEIRVQSRPGRGSMFALELPTSECFLPNAPTSPVCKSVFTIGLVEDNRNILAALDLALKSLGHKVYSGTTESELMNQLGQITPDIVISDYQLESEHTGLEVINILRNQFGEELPAIVLTDNTDSSLSSALQEQRIAVYTKPIPLNELQENIERAIQGKPDLNRMRQDDLLCPWSPAPRVSAHASAP